MEKIILSIISMMIGATLGIFFLSLVIVAKESDNKIKDKKDIEEKNN